MSSISSFYRVPDKYVRVERESGIKRERERKREVVIVIVRVIVILIGSVGEPVN